MGVPYSWLVLAGIILGILLVARWVLRDAKLHGMADVERDISRSDVEAARREHEAEAQARDEFEAKRTQVEAGDMNAAFHVERPGGPPT